MNEPLASLSSRLLARKGEARPAMRSQATNAAGQGAPDLDDLGWNDMGDPPAPPPVLIERQALQQRVVSDAAAQRVARVSAAATAEGKAAFTLRLDGERHLRLRLASAISNVSAQGLVTRALDEFLEAYPQMDALISHLSTGER